MTKRTGKKAPRKSGAKSNKQEPQVRTKGHGEVDLIEKRSDDDFLGRPIDWEGKCVGCGDKIDHTWRMIPLVIADMHDDCYHLGQWPSDGPVDDAKVQAKALYDFAKFQLTIFHALVARALDLSFVIGSQRQAGDVQAYLSVLWELYGYVKRELDELEPRIQWMSAVLTSRHIADPFSAES